MRIVLLLLCVVMLAVSGWYIWQGIAGEPEPPQRTVAKADTSPAAPQPAPVESTIVQNAPAPATQPAVPAPSVESAQADTPSPSVTMTIGQATEEDSPTKKLLDEAVDAFNAGDYRTSLRLFTEVLPEDKSALTGIGLSHYKLGDYRTAVTMLERSVQENGEEFKALKFLSLAHYNLDDLAKSETYAARALARGRDPELRQFYEKIRREQAALVNRVDESNLHFKVIFDGYEHGSISRPILDILDRAYRDIGREFGHFPDRTITVVLYTERDFFDVTRAPSWAGGLYDGKIRVPVKGAESADRELLRTVLYHEYVHAMVHDIAREVPRWVHEGLAEYLVPRGLENIGQVIPFRSLESAFFSGEHRVVITAYQESYSAMDHLVDRYSLYDVKEFLLALGRGEPVAQAFNDTFYITYDEFASSWAGR